jgi:hypothetical protein
MLAGYRSRTIRAAWLDRPDLPDAVVVERLGREQNPSLRLHLYANARKDLTGAPSGVWESAGALLGGTAEGLAGLCGELDRGVPDALIGALAAAAGPRRLPVDVLVRLAGAARTEEELCQLAGMCPPGGALPLAEALLVKALALRAPGADQTTAFCHLPVTEHDRDEVADLVSAHPLTGKADTMAVLQDPCMVYEQLLLGRGRPGSAVEAKLNASALHRADLLAEQLAGALGPGANRCATGTAAALARNVNLPAQVRAGALANCQEGELEAMLADHRRNGSIMPSVEGELHARGRNTTVALFDAAELEQRLVETLSLTEGHRVLERLCLLPEDAREVAFGLIDAWESTFGELIDTAYALVG